MRIVNTFFVSCVLLGLAGVPLTIHAAEKNAGQTKVTELEKRIKQLEKEVTVLSGIVEGTAKPINLGRTSLASVSASSVNGGRGLNNKFYGVTNAFDDGSNWHNNINYTYWLSSGSTGQWIDVRFDSPVTLTSFHIESRPGAAPGFTARVTFAKGGQKVLTSEKSEMNLPDPAHGVQSVRLFFPQAPGNVTVNEIRIMGHVKPGAKYKVGRPRLQITRRSAELMAGQEYEQWRLNLAAKCLINTTENEKQVVVSYSIGGQVVFRVTVNKHDGSVTRQSFVNLVPTDSAGNTPAKK